MRSLLVVLWIWAGCGGDDDGPIDAGGDAAGQTADAAGQTGDGGGLCSGSADCDGEVCCDPGVGAGCVPTFDDCQGLVLCDGPGDCPEVNPTCCPQGFCGGCD